MNENASPVFQVTFEHWTFNDIGTLSRVCRAWRDLLDSNDLEFWRRKWAQLFLSPAPRLDDSASFKRLCFYRSRFDEKGRLGQCINEDERAMVRRLIERKQTFLRRLEEEDRWALVRQRTHQGRDVYFCSHTDDRPDPTRSISHLRVVIFLDLDGKVVVPLKVEFNHDMQPLRGEQEERAVFGCNFAGEIFAYYRFGDYPASSEFYHKRMDLLNELVLGKERPGIPNRWLVELLGLDRFIDLLNQPLDEEGLDLEPICEKDDPEWEDSWALPIGRNMFSLTSASEDEETDEGETEDDEDEMEELEEE